MNKNLQAKLYESYPNIFRQKDLSAQETAMCWGIACGAGWYNIVDVLCMHLKYLIDEPHKNIKMYTEWSNKASSKAEIKKYQSYIDLEKQKIIPQLEAVQVKEKYGTLRFYLHQYPSNEVASAKVREVISFAESMSACTCELCGRPGTLNTGSSWLSVRCPTCRVEEKEARLEFFREAQQLKIPFGDK